MRFPLLTAVLLVAVRCAGLLAADDVPLIDPAAPTAGWSFGNGAEFPGAKGSLEADPAQQYGGKPSLRLVADLGGGGNYVQMGRNLAALDLDLDTLSFWLKAPQLTGVTLRLIDGTDQCHQFHLRMEPASADWRLITLPVDRFFAKAGTAEAITVVSRHETWGGAKDGKWHGRLRGISLLAGKAPGATGSTIWVSGLTASVRHGSSGWSCDFESAAGLPAGWTTEGAVDVIGTDAFQGQRALRLGRTAGEREKLTSATSPSFPVAAGTWEVSCAAALDLASPDASYSGTVTLEALDGAGAAIERTAVVDAFGARPWQLVRTRVAIPRQAVAARLVARLNKTVGTFRIDALAAKPIDIGRKPPAVDRIVFASPSLGNLFLPDAPRTFAITVETLRELTAAERTLTWSVRDYWGAEQAPAAALTVSADGKNKERFRYRGAVDLAGLPLEIGRYYEIHAQVPLGDDDPFRNWSSFAVLPPAPTRAYRPDQIPFTARTWDNRSSDYMRLADRLGIRIGGIWGGAEVDPPYKPHAPTMDVAASLGMAVLTGAPAGIWAIEHHGDGYEKWTEEAIRGAIRSWFAAYGAHVPGPLVVNLGNEPNNTGERLREAVRAYKIAYDEIKKVSPGTIVVATSVGATEEYFQLGYQDACDAFDFHVYEAPKNVREAVLAFKAMMAEHHCEKPVWSTEIGLNSQGMTRQYISADMARKTAAFFAAGGASMAWFGFLYPDPDGKALGTTGDSFNMFDSRYLQYAARLDAVMHYNLVNGICVKKFAQERAWGDGIHGCLFRDADGRCFALLWKDKGRADVFLPLAGVREVRSVRIDGRRTVLDAGGTGIALTASEDPVLLEYAGPAALPESLGAAPLRIASAPAALVRGVPGTVEVATAADPARVSLIAPPGWTVARAADAPLRFTVASPEASAVREGDLLVRLAAGPSGTGGIAGELGVRPTITGRLTVEVRPVPAAGDGRPAAQVVVSNLSSTPETVTWALGLTGELVVADGQYGAPAPTSAHLADAGNGSLLVPAKGRAVVTVPLAGTDPIALYVATASITDAAGGTVATERRIGGFVAVPRTAAPQVDGVLDEAAWSRATVCRLDQARQYLALGKEPAWKGADDLSAALRFLWDDRCLYVGVQVTDDVFANAKAGGEIWAGDGLQFLFDPKRESAEKPGKYDLGMALGTRGPQAWCWLSASSATTPGAVADIAVAVKRGERGDATYEIAIPWANLAPFAPKLGADLGATMIVNEDDGPGRRSFIGWFGNPHTKQIDTAGDLILVGE